MWSNILSFFTFEWEKKLVALFVSVLLWYYVNSLTYVEQTLNLPVQYKNLPESMVVVENFDPAASFVVKGKVEQVKKINLSKAIRPVVNLEQATLGVNSYPIEISINAPQSDLIINLLKDKVRLKIDKLVTNTVTVEAVMNGIPKPGYKVEQVILSMKSVVVRGPAELLGELKVIQTEPIPVNDATNDISAVVYLSPPKLVTVVGESRVSALAKVSRKAEQSEFEELLLGDTNSQE